MRDGASGVVHKGEGRRVEFAEVELRGIIATCLSARHIEFLVRATIEVIRWSAWIRWVFISRIPRCCTK